MRCARECLFVGKKVEMSSLESCFGWRPVFASFAFHALLTGVHVVVLTFVGSTRSVIVVS